MGSKAILRGTLNWPEAAIFLLLRIVVQAGAVVLADPNRSAAGTLYCEEVRLSCAGG